jgi:precorrin-4/cobalt-precorrin-4 C11-methyltransferase
MVYFIGAGPGDPELLTIKAKRIIDGSDVVIYAGSLVNREVLSGVREECVIHDSAGMTLDEVVDVIERAVGENKVVSRVHTGDPSIYGAIREQMDRLSSLDIRYECIPGVSSFLAAASALRAEYTLPGVTQTVILTRMEGRTPVPKSESIESLATHKATMIIFLSIGMIDKLAERLSGSYPGTTPVAVVYKASWPDQMIVRGTLEDIASKVREEGIGKTALVAVGDFLGGDYELSKLYDKEFSHGYRSAE